MKKPTHFTRATAMLTGLFAFAGLSQIANAQLITINNDAFQIHTSGYASSVLTANLGDSAPGGLPASGGGTEDTWGIFQITSITDGGATDFTYNGTYELWGVFYNSVDQSAVFDNPEFEFTASGMKLDIYQVFTNDLNDDMWELVYNQGVGGRAGIDGYTGITDVGTLVFESSLTGLMYSDFNTVTNTTNAQGNLVVSGVNTLFDINTIDLTFALAGNTTAVPSDWTVGFGGPVAGLVTAVPEPSTYGLMAAGALAGLVVLRRRKQKSAQV